MCGYTISIGRTAVIDLVSISSCPFRFLVGGSIHSGFVVIVLAQLGQVEYDPRCPSPFAGVCKL